MGLDDRLRAAMGGSDTPAGAPTMPEVLRRRARVRVWRQRTSLAAAVLVVAVTASVVVVQQRNHSGSQLVAAGPGLVQVPIKAQVAVASVRRAAPNSTGVPSLVAANSQFAFDLYQQLAQESPGQNLVFSPESISYALAMAYAGARGATATQLGKALHFDGLPADQLNVAFNALAQSLLAPRTSVDKGRAPLKLSMSNSVWGQSGFPLEQAFLDVLARYYGAGLRLGDFARDAEQARERINTYVAQQTDHRITELIPRGAIDDMTRFVLVNTITFTADWRTPFTKALTSPQPFTRLDGSRVDVPMMAQAEGDFDGYRGDNFVAASLPYEGGASMLVIVPNAGQFSGVEKSLSPALVQQTINGLASGANVFLPKFTFDAHADLVSALRALGMSDAFDPERADFTGIAPKAGLYVSHVEHEATIKVDEEGTKAAAATAVVGEATSGRLYSLVVDANRPFIYLIRDDATGAILFAGRVLDPTQT